MNTEAILVSLRALFAAQPALLEPVKAVASAIDAAEAVARAGARHGIASNAEELLLHMRDLAAPGQPRPRPAPHIGDAAGAVQQAAAGDQAKIALLLRSLQTPVTAGLR